MMRNLRRNVRLLRESARLLREQGELIEHLELERRRSELMYVRIGRDLIEQFLITLDQPETHDVIRDALSQSLRVFNDQIAIIEEHT
jgi:hypothetical protein